MCLPQQLTPVRIPWGIFATIGPAYASELCPLAIRPYLTAYTNMCFATGQLIGAGVLKSLINRPGVWSWRIPFAIQWIWPPFLLVAACLMPESPWWLVRQGRTDDAEKVMLRLMTPHEHHNARPMVSMMVHTNEIEKEITEGTSYFDCFRGFDLRRTEIACVAFVGQITCGAQFAYSATYFFEQAGLSPDNAYAVNLGDTGLAFCGTIASWFLMRYFGRRALYLPGMSAMCLLLLIIGFLTLSNNPNAAWGQAAMCFLWLLSFSLTIGPVGWAIPPEVSSTRLRSKTVVLARNTYYVAQIVANVLEPYMINPTEWNWNGYTGFFWCGTAFCSIVWAFFRLPETKGRTYEELDIMFASKLPTRKFKIYEIDAYDDTQALTDRARKV